MKRTSKLVQNLRQWRGKTPQYLAANALDVSVRTYQNWEQGRNTPPPMVESQINQTIKKLVEITKGM